MDTAPKERIGRLMERHEFLAKRNGNVIICWWEDDRHAVRPKPYWGGSDGHHNATFCRSNAPDGWMPFPSDDPTALLARMAEALKLAAEYGLWFNHLADLTSRDAREAAERKISEALAEYKAGKESAT